MHFINIAQRFVYGLKAISQNFKLITNLNWLFNYTLCYSQLFNKRKNERFKIIYLERCTN